MPVLINGGNIVGTDNGVDVPLTEEQSKTVVLTKYISNDPKHADWQPDKNHPWLEECTADIGGGKKQPRLLTTDANGERAVSVDDGFIIQLHGTFSRMVGILPGRPPMTPEDVEAHTEATDEMVPLFQQWDFRVHKVLKTNGPEGRYNLLKSEDQKRAKAQEDMFVAIADAFRKGMAQSSGLAPKAGDVLALAKK